MEHPQIVERQYNHFKAQISDAKSQTGPLGEHRLGDVREFPPFTPPYGTLVNNPLPGFEYRAPIDGIRFTHSPNTVSDPGATTNAGYPGNMTAADVVRNIAGAIRP